jgi:transcriptional regulator with XRE-family HTH domain
MRKKNSQFVKHLGEALDSVQKQSELARLIGVSESRIPEWMKGTRLPSPDTLINLGKLALERGLPDPFFFWALAGVDTQTLRKMADRVRERQYELVGPTVPVPRFRETLTGREEVGPPVALPTEFLPNPLATICLLVDEKSTAVVSSPRGLVILDTSFEGVDDLSALWERVVMLRYAPTVAAYEKGIYVGRLLLEQTSRTWRNAEAPRFNAVLEMISRMKAADIARPRHILLGSCVDSEGMRGLAPEDLQGRSHRWEEIQARTRAEFRLPHGVSILAKVIGRLTGHLEVAEMDEQ